MRQRRRYNRTISHAAWASPTPRLVNKRQCSGSWFVGGLISRASTRVIDTVAAFGLGEPQARPLEANRASPQGDRPDPAGIAHAARRDLDMLARQIRPRRRAGEKRSCDNRPIRCELDRTVLRARTVRSTPRPTGEATVDVALGVADHHHGRRIRQQFIGSLDPSQAAHALLAPNRPLTPWRLDRVVTGPDPGVEQTENSLRLAVNGD